MNKLFISISVSHEIREQKHFENVDFHSFFLTLKK